MSQLEMSVQRRTRKRLRGGKRRKSRRQNNVATGTNSSTNSSSANFTVDPTSENTSTPNLSQLPATAAYLSNGNTNKNANNNNLGNNPFGSISTNVLANTNEEATAKKEYAKEFNQSKFTNVTNTLNTELPPGWRAVKYNNGNVYYENTKTGKTQYNYPTVTRAGDSTNLPEGWETYSFQGENFYVDPQGESHWNKPAAGNKNKNKNKNTRQVVENEIMIKEEVIPGPLPSQTVVNKNTNKNKNANNTPSLAGLFGNNNLEVENLKKNSVTGNGTVKANKARNVEASPAGLFGNNNLEVENLKKNSVTGNATLKANKGSDANQRRNKPSNDRITVNNRRRTNNQSKNTCPVCPVCPKPNQQSTEKMKKVLEQLKNIQSFVTTIKSTL